ncbi:formylglycine-generating enzyme family protein [Stieleria varia]|uniref:Serine/threonine-protein kinase pkn1 n=1 Tax=Stieleria varia TaxID=2528005 RepID=A0A5C5ZLN8_9BACT|nr:SUMF1/EgtB/PvdO family nonheme iron enzyme [Stieleria varia]TWT88060.1 Serine/threonine-protein kinase pkn1 [Stieleria varia]
MSLTSFFRSPLSVFSLGTAKQPVPSGQNELDFADAAPDVRRLIRDRRYIKILAPSDGVEFDAASINHAWKAVEQDMAYVPPGHVTLVNEYAISQDGACGLSPGVVGASEVAAFYLDRTPVTNADYAKFVDAGGYDDYQLWPEHILEALLQFVDATGQPGPANWAQGKPAVEKRNHPVVGICWYEANAYAQWSGKRLPTSAEWQRAGTWGKSPGDSTSESQYPWGNSFDPAKANTWAAGRNATAPVTEFAAGSTPNGVRQLIGNVWEWMNTQYVLQVTEDVTVHFDEPMAEVRGGAFDSYFHSQATCKTRSGQPLSARRHNIGFRCCQLADSLTPPSNEPHPTTQDAEGVS